MNDVVYAHVNTKLLTSTSEHFYFFFRLAYTGCYFFPSQNSYCYFYPLLFPWYFLSKHPVHHVYPSEADYIVTWLKSLYMRLNYNPIVFQSK